MAHYNATVETPLAPDDVFAYLSDFSTTEQWDPGTTHAERLGDGPIGKGTKFKLRARFLGSESELVYEVSDFEAPGRVVLRGENAAVVSLDEMTFEPASGGGTRMTYDATLSFKGPLRFADPLLSIAFRRVGDRALEGLRTTLESSARRVSPTYK
jgi:uncharacterized protein YndB with AHSA1/START domain